MYTGILYVYTYQTYTTVIEEIQRYVSSIDYFQTISAIIYQPERRIRGKEEKWIEEVAERWLVVILLVTEHW